MTRIALSLVSHTNVGKTTLARTLLRRDVGEVLDQAHVTEAAEGFELVAADGHVLELFDTPGLGDSVRLLARMRQESNPLGWFLHQVWDRVRDRPLWSSQEALRNVRERADVVLYLVNASERPEEAGYVKPELDVLALLGVPLVVLLNQTGAPGRDLAADVDAWRAFLAPWPAVRAILPLDAFTRSWTQEDALLARLEPLLSDE
jgi:predicted GTPase